MRDAEELHRYELIEERRARERRGGLDDAANGHSNGERRDGDRRGHTALLDSEPARRVFPIEEAADGWGATRRHLRLRLLLTLADALALAVALLAARASGDASLSATAIVVGVVAGTLVARVSGLHDKDPLVLRRSTLDETPRLLQLAAVIVLAYWLVLDEEVGREEVLSTWVVLLVALVVLRGGARALARRTMPAQRCLYLGDEIAYRYVKGKVDCSRANGEVVCSVFLHTGDTALEFGGIEGLQALVREHDIDRVLIAPVSTDAADTLELIRVAKLACTQVSIFPRLFEVVGSAVEFEDLDGMILVGVRRFGLTPSARRVKRAFDLVLGTLLLILSLPVAVVAAAAIRLDTRGPILFRQERVGRDGRPFCMFKFRTMVEDAEALKPGLRADDAYGLFKLADDPRVTRAGRLLRATSLDELPQLLNVLRGDMSLVGPRPLVDEEDDQILGLDRSRLHLTPGMTGPWQVMRSGRAPMHEMVSMDYLYVSNWSLWTDLKLLLRTAFFVAARRGM